MLGFSSELRTRSTKAYFISARAEASIALQRAIRQLGRHLIDECKAFRICLAYKTLAVLNADRNSCCEQMLPLTGLVQLRHFGDYCATSQPQ